MTRIVENGTLRDMTTAEETEHTDRLAQWTLEKPMIDWETAMQKTDKEMPRYLEDALDDGGIKATGRTKTRLDDKKALRAERPGS